MADEKTTTSRKWKLTIAMLALYTVVYGASYVMVSFFLVKEVVPPEIWKDVTMSQLAMWSYAAFAVSGWYLGVNVIQKWSPFPGSGVK
ncbi:MAG: hypothetical protein DRR06_13450 [Gammaproteobacteria bacterium]|nr:MAG: hypothetical protein DRR06_13450 [Gammaproteobacteria bacterium]